MPFHPDDRFRPTDAELIRLGLLPDPDPAPSPLTSLPSSLSGASPADRLSGLVRAVVEDEPKSITAEDALAALAFARAIGVILWKRSHNRRPAPPSVEYAEAYLELVCKGNKGGRASR